MDLNLLLDPDWWTAARAAAAAAVVTALTAVVAVGAALSQLNAAVNDSEQRTRPIISARLTRIPHNRGYLNLTISNKGQSLARHVVVTFQPPLPDSTLTRSKQASVIPYLKRRYVAPISSLTPGEELNNLYYAPTDTHGAPHQNDEPVPDQFRVVISYSPSVPKRQWWRRAVRYTESFNLDVGLHMMETNVSSSTAPEAQLREAVKTLDTMRQSLAYLAGSFKDLTDLGIRYRTHAADRRRKRDQEAKNRSHQERRERHDKLADRVLKRRRK